MATNDCNKTKPCGCEDQPYASLPPCNPIDCPDPIVCSEINNAQCIIYTGPNLQCGSEDVVSQNSSMNQVIEDIINYFCNLTPSVPTTVVEGGTDIEVTSEVVDDVTTYTVNYIGSPIVYYGYGEGEVAVSLLTYPLWDVLPALSHGDLAYTVSEAGLYKVTLDIEWAQEDEFANALVGISVNGADPLASPFSQSLMLLNMSKTFHFILTGISAGDELRVVFRGNPSGVVLVNRIKMIIEK
jgi:hypothetical protein